MILCIGNVLSPEQLDKVRKTLHRAAFVDGRTTAGWHARTVKRNRQAAPGDKALEQLRAELLQVLSGHEVFRTAVHPKAFRPLMFSRYEPGMQYGTHVDDAIMGAGTAQPIRTDVSFTLFLAPPEDYRGGELVIESSAGEQSYKLDAGAAVVYPSTSLHRVEPVTEGIREVAVGWTQSLVREPDRREILFDLDVTRRALFEREGKSPTFDTLTRTHANLLRMWAEL